jgi:hypothetical protein
VFASGAMVGVVGHRLYTCQHGKLPRRHCRRTAFPPEKDPEEFKRHIVADMKEKIKLDEQQVKQLEQIMDQTREQFEQLHKTVDEKMRRDRGAIWLSQVEQTKEILRPEQLPLYEKVSRGPRTRSGKKAGPPRSWRSSLRQHNSRPTPEACRALRYGLRRLRRRA